MYPRQGKWKKYTNRHIVVNSRIPNIVVILSQNGNRGAKKRTVWDAHKGTLKVYNLGRRKMIPEGSLRGKKKWWAKKW